ncbi:MAG: aldo/keto reductase [Bacilli bacterium]
MSRIALGLMRIGEMSVEEVEGLINHALDTGVKIFDLADIYGDGASEELLGKVLKKNPALREKMYIQSKCGICKDTIGYDLSCDNIIYRVKASLTRLGISYLDCLFLHRPDVFMDNEEVAKAINYLLDNKFIKEFAVSNFSSSEIKYLQKKLPCPIKFNQIQLGIGNTSVIDQVFNVGLSSKFISKEADDLFFFLKEENIAIQCWSPFLVGFFEGSIFDKEKYPKISNALEHFAVKYNTSLAAIAVSFLLRITPSLMVVIGSTNFNHMDQALEGEKITLSRQDWYSLYSEAGHFLP